jgi:protein O-mannosyl-transferase
MDRMTRTKKQGRRPPNPSPGAASETRAARYWALAVGVAAVVVYLNAFGHDFVLDDTRIIQDNVRIRSIANVPGLFASSYWGQSGTNALYRPLALATYAINYAVHGLWTSGYTAVNVALHAVVSLLLFGLVRGLGGSLLAAGIAGVVYAVHPVHTEAVTGMAGRPELLAAFFFLLAMRFHRLVPGGGHRALGCRVATLACFACALLSKESAITLLLVLPLMDALVPARNDAGHPVRPLARLVTDYVPLAAVAVAYLLVRHAVLGGVAIAENIIAPLDNPLVAATTLPLGERLGATSGQAVMTAFAVVVEYARLLVWPARLSADYSFNQIPLVSAPLDPRFLAGVAIAVACATAIVWLWRRNRLAAFGLAFLAATFSVVSNFLVTIGTICAERLMYLPSAGAAVAAGVGAAALIGTPPGRKRVATIAIAAVIVLGAARTWSRNQDWQNERTLWSSALEVAPASARVQSEYGRVVMSQADEESRAGRTADAERHYAEAQAHFETALKIYPSYSPPMDGLATILASHQRYDEAVVLYERAVKVWPGSFASVTNWAGLLWDRSRRLADQAAARRAGGRTADAEALQRQANAGYEEALEKVNHALEMQPSYTHAHLIRALLLDGYVGDRAGAIAEFQTVLRLSPDHPQRGAIDEELRRLTAAQTVAPASP